MNTVKIDYHNISTFTKADVALLAERLESDTYDNPFAGLTDWHLLRSLAFQRPELVEHCRFLLDLDTL